MSKYRYIKYTVKSIANLHYDFITKYFKVLRTKCSPCDQNFTKNAEKNEPMYRGVCNCYNYGTLHVEKNVWPQNALIQALKTSRWLSGYKRQPLIPPLVYKQPFPPHIKTTEIVLNR